MQIKSVNIWKLICKNWFFIAILLGLLFCYVTRYEHQPEAMISNQDSTIEFATENSSLEQTWLSNAKYLHEISIPFTSHSNFTSELELAVVHVDTDQILYKSNISNTFEQNQSGILAFPTGILKIIPGEQYKFVLRYIEPSSEGSLELPTGSNYTGASIDGTSCNKAMAYSLDLLKYTRLFWLCFTLFPLFAISFIFMLWFNKKFEETVGLSFVLMILFLYLFALFKHLEMGILILFISSFISFLGGIALFNIKKRTLKDLFSPAIPIFFIGVIVILLNCRGMFLARWDEFSHWGLAAKDMFIYNQFAWHADSTVMLPRYMPFATLTEYFYVYGNGIFSEGTLYVAFQMTLLSSLCIALKIGRYSKKMIVPAVLFLFTILITFIPDVYNCLYVDSLLIGWVAYILICYWTEKMDAFNYMRIIAGLIALTLTKDMGLVLAAILCLFMFLDALVLSLKEKKIVWKVFGQSLLGLVIVLITFFSWQVFLKQPITVSQNASIAESAEQTQTVTTANSISASGITVGNLVDLIQGDAPHYRYTAIKNFVSTIFDSDTYKFGTLELSYMDLLMAIILITIIIGVILKKKLSENTLVIKSIYILFGGILYAGFLMITYLFAFTMADSLLLPSHERYLASYLGGVIIALGIMVLWKYVTGKRNESKTVTNYAIMIMCILLVMIFPIRNLVFTNMDTSITEEQLHGFDDLERQCRSFGHKGDKMYVICNETANGFSLILHSYVSPMIPDGAHNIFGSQEALDKQTENGGTGTVLAVEELQKQLQDYQYVFIMHPSETFSESYGIIFEDKNTIQSGTFYKVNYNQEKELQLIYIGQASVESYF